MSFTSTVLECSPLAIGRVRVPSTPDAPASLARVRAARGAELAERPLLDLLAENKESTTHLNRAELAKLCDPANYLGQWGVMVDRVLASLCAS